MTALFISDLHLDKDRPQIIAYFKNLIDNLDPNVESLYILGDFVEFWVGDDDPADGLTDVFDSIKKNQKNIVYILCMVIVIL